MPVAVGKSSPALQHIVLDDVSWDFYEQLLRETAEQRVRITYDQGRLEMMSPLPKHERWGSWIARLVELMCLERGIPVESLGSTTYRNRLRKQGLEPDECFYVQHAAAAGDMEEAFDPKLHFPPDLALEIDITNRSIDREPLYAALGVRELWRFDGRRLHVLHLSTRKKYVGRVRSRTFPFLPVAEFETFVLRMTDKDQVGTLNEFRAWVNAFRV